MRSSLPSLLVLVGVISIGCAADDPPVSTTPGLEVEILRDIVLTPEARIPENDPAYVGVEVQRDRLIFELDGALAEPLEEGSVIVGSGGPSGFLRRARSVTTLPDGRIEVLTEYAQLVDLIYQGHFIVRYTPPEGDPAASSEALVEGVAGKRAALDTVTGAVVLIPAGPGIPIACGGGATSEASVNPYLDFDYVFELEVDIDWERAWLVVPKPKLAKFRLELGGSVAGGIAVEGSGGWVATCELDIADLAGAPSIELPPLTFAVGPVPVVIGQEIEPVFKFGVTERVESESFNWSAGAGFGLTIGVLYEDEEWSPIWEPDAWADGTFHSGGRGMISITDRVSAGLEYQARIYELAGPNMGLEGFIEASGGTGADLCTWELSIESGLTATFGGEIEIDVDLGPVTVDWTIAEIQIAEVDLVRSPLWTGSGTFPWCDECEVGAATCTDDTGREICLGNRGVIECAGGTQVCTCSTGGAFTDCGECIVRR